MAKQVSDSNEHKATTEHRELGYNYRITDDYVFFMDGFLHQWYKASINIDEFEYNCCEQYMMAEKAILFNDQESVHKLRKCENPLDQKTIGRQIKNFNEKVWQKHRFNIVYQGNLCKFKQHKHLRDKLLSYPYTMQFVNANPGDKIWGIGVGVFEAKVVDANNWNGLNLLGKVITTVRNTLIPTLSNQKMIENINKKSVFITAGYLRFIEKTYNFIIPNEIILLVSQFFVLLEDVRFTVFNAQNCVVDDGLICKTSNAPHLARCHRLFASDKGYDNGVIIWKIKFTTGNLQSVEGAIGIISGFDRNRIVEKRPWINDDSFTDLVYWSRIGCKIGGVGGMRVGVKWIDGDIITILLNCSCQQWYVEFYLNDKLLKDIHNVEFNKILIENNRKYYPVLAFYDGQDQYEVLL